MFFFLPIEGYVELLRKCGKGGETDQGSHAHRLVCLHMNTYMLVHMRV